MYTLVNQSRDNLLLIRKETENILIPAVLNASVDPNLKYYYY